MVDTDTKLTAYLPGLRDSSWVAVDTEADSLHAYPEKVCLIQISTLSGDCLIDPLAELDLGPLLETLGQRELIMHGADYDLRLLRKCHEFVPRSIFDTMLAARLLGLRQFSLSYLVERTVGVKLEKGPQKANWALRPLTERMERYARNDTHYLKALSDQLRAELESKNRLDWHRESCARLIEDSSRERVADLDAVWRVKGSHRLSRQALAVLRELWQWREREATAANKPPFFVLSHQLLVDVAVAATNGHATEPLLPKHLSERRRAGVLEAVAHGLSLPPEQYPRILRSVNRRPSEGERRRFLELQERRDARAAELDLDPTLIASRAMLSDLAHNWDQAHDGLMSWQRQLLTSS